MGDLVILPCLTKLEVPTGRIIEQLQEVKDLTQILVLGYHEDGALHVSSSSPSLGDCLLLLERAKQFLLDYEEDDD